MTEIPKDDPATKGDVENLRKEMHSRFETHERLQAEGLEGHRQQQSAEHGTLFSKLTYLTEMAVWIKTWALKLGRAGNRNTSPGDDK